MKETILVLDFGSQYNQLIARSVRAHNVFCKIVNYDISPEEVSSINPKGLIFSGGPASVYAANAIFPNKKLLALGIPILGICYGMQAMAHMMEGKVKKAKSREYGNAEIRFT